MSCCEIPEYPIYAAVEDEKEERNSVDEGQGVEGEDFADIMVFPDMRVYACVKKSDLASFVDIVLVKKQDFKGYGARKIDKHLVFICGHTLRDKRCGVVGEMLKQQFNHSLADENQSETVFPLLISHIGGHAFAGMQRYKHAFIN